VGFGEVAPEERGVMLGSNQGAFEGGIGAAPQADDIAVNVRGFRGG